MPVEDDIKQLIGVLQTMKAKNAFGSFVDRMVFPRYRNISPKTQIDFAFPLTVLVGQNGSGKTAVLQALYGAPEGSSVRDWWFETYVDPIDEPPPEVTRKRRRSDIPEAHRSRFWYSYRDEKGERQAIKTRISRAFDPDNWEPSRPLVGSGMTKLPGKMRHPQIHKTPIYVNFKNIINSFDKCFYFISKTTLSNFANTPTWRAIFKDRPEKYRQPRVQDFLRIRSKKLKHVLQHGDILMAGKYPLNEAARPLSGTELNAINMIICKRYTGGSVVRHRFFDGWGTTVAFSTAERNYTDAFAGSGEGSVVRLVLEIEKAENGSLVLLDEPETSLHPGAQVSMLAYLLGKIKTKKLQIVISTHSPTLVSLLPREAIKVFSLNADGLVDVVPNLSAQEAFHYIGHRYDADINVVVEDKLAKAVLDAAIDSKGEAIKKRFRVSFGAGGDSSIKKSMVVYSRWPNRPIVIFDGDLRPHSEPDRPLHIDPGSIMISDQNSKHLKELMDAQAGQSVDFPKDSNMAEEAQCAVLLDFLDYYNRCVYYMPFPTPEQAIWSEEGCQHYIASGVPNQDEVRRYVEVINAMTNYKDRYARMAELTKTSVDSIHSIFVARFTRSNSDDWNKLVNLVTRINNSNV